MPAIVALGMQPHAFEDAPSFLVAAARGQLVDRSSAERAAAQGDGHGSPPHVDDAVPAGVRLREVVRGIEAEALVRQQTSRSGLRLDGGKERIDVTLAQASLGCDGWL